MCDECSVSWQLRHMALETGGAGIFLLTVPGRQLPSIEAIMRAEWAAHQLGFVSLAGALEAGALPDVLSEAIEAVETP